MPAVEAKAMPTSIASAECSEKSTATATLVIFDSFPSGIIDTEQGAFRVSFPDSFPLDFSRGFLLTTTRSISLRRARYSNSNNH